MLATAIACSLGDSSTPTIARNGYSDAINKARPLPDPKSTNVYFSKSSWSRWRICRNAEGATPKYPALNKSLWLPLGRSSANSSPLVSTPNCRSKGCTETYSFARSIVLEPGRKPLRNNNWAVAITPRCARDLRNRYRIRRRFNFPRRLPF
jgi:hypothetical protein